MKKTDIAIVMILASLTANIAQSAQKDNTWYVGSRLGLSQYHDTGWHNNSLSNSGKAHKSHLGVGISGGYQVNPFVGFEMGYDWIGRIPHKGNIQNGEFKSQGIQMAVKFGYPIANDLDLYTRLGGMVWRADSKKYNNANNSHDTGVSPVLSGGVEWAVTRNIATRLEYQWINNIGDNNTVNLRPDNGLLSLGIFYRFGQNDTVLANNQIPVSSHDEMQSKNFTLKSDILFNFNKTTLKPEGQQALDQLYTQLINLDPEEGSIVVLGFTDRLGSDAYNQDLSEKRAQSVVDYLVFKGVQRNKISIRSMGASHSITGDTCDNVKNRSDLISCLAPDRRVEIKVKNIRNVETQSDME